MVDLKQAKAEVKAARGRIWRAAGVLLGSRAVAGVACLLAIVFGMTLLFSPRELPTGIGGFSLVAVGLPPLELGKEKEVLGDIVGAAQRQGGAEQARGFFEANPQAAFYANWIGFGLSVLVLFWGIVRQSQLWRQGVRPF
jgi:hypothetical protein